MIGNQTFGGSLITGTVIKPFFIGMNVITSLATGIPFGDFSGESVNLFPNPVSDLLTLDLTLTENKKITVRVINLLGQDVHINQSANGLQGLNEVQLDVSALSGSIYFAQIVLEGNVAATKRFVVSK